MAGWIPPPGIVQPHGSSHFRGRIPGEPRCDPAPAGPHRGPGPRPWADGLRRGLLRGRPHPARRGLQGARPRGLRGADAITRTTASAMPSSAAGPRPRSAWPSCSRPSSASLARAERGRRRRRSARAAASRADGPPARTGHTEGGPDAAVPPRPGGAVGATATERFGETFTLRLYGPGDVVFISGPGFAQAAVREPTG